MVVAEVVPNPAWEIVHLLDEDNPNYTACGNSVALVPIQDSERVAQCQSCLQRVRRYDRTITHTREDF